MSETFLTCEYTVDTQVCESTTECIYFEIKHLRSQHVDLVFLAKFSKNNFLLSFE